MQAGGQRFESVILHLLISRFHRFHDFTVFNRPFVNRPIVQSKRSLTCWENEKLKLKIKLQIEKENTISLETISQVQLKVYETTVFVDILYFIFNIYRRSVRAKKVGKGAWWMPRLLQAKKDVISCDKPRGGANDH